MGVQQTDEMRQSDYCSGYSDDVDSIRKREYPMLQNTTYLDHAGTTLYAKSLIESFSQDLTSNLYGNPHSVSSSSQLSTRRIDDVRLRVLRFFNADPDEFDLVFVANATAAIKVVADTFRDNHPSGFWYGYHVESHTSLIGARELAQAGSRCFLDDAEVDDWIHGLRNTNSEAPRVPKLFAFPAQSNLNGRRFPRRWCEDIRTASRRTNSTVFTLLDAASLVATAPLDLSNASTAPDFTALSFYKIFGFPDLGALIVRKSAGDIFERRKYFGGGTVGMVLAVGGQWHAKKDTSVHDKLEDGTLPFHSIIALDSALDVHHRLYGSMENISRHTRFLARRLYDRLISLRHANGVQVCHVHRAVDSEYGDASTQGPIVAFNLRDSNEEWIGRSEVERLAAVKNIQLRSGTVCNPGGTASIFGWSVMEMMRQYARGVRCGDDHDFMDGKPAGVLRVSLGAMSSIKDIDALIEFIDEFYVEKTVKVIPVPVPVSMPPKVTLLRSTVAPPRFRIESLTVYPIKSCGGFRVPEGQRWEVRKEGLAWDREWCLIHQGTGAALNQKKYPRMALIRPHIDLRRGVLRVHCGNTASTTDKQKGIEIPLSRDESNLASRPLCQNTIRKKSSLVCGDRVTVQTYTCPDVTSFFSDFLGVPCTLARFPPRASSPRYSRRGRADDARPSTLQTHHARERLMPGSFPTDTHRETVSRNLQHNHPILLSNESPILLISRSSVNRLNETIKSSPSPTTRLLTPITTTSKAVAADVFRANIIVAETPFPSNNHNLNLLCTERGEQPYIEDSWTSFSIFRGGDDLQASQDLRFDVLGSCQRCQMVCVDQFTGEKKGDEPYSTLAKTRRVDGKVLFGRHVALAVDNEDDGDEDGGGGGDDGGLEFSERNCAEQRQGRRRFVMVGDAIVPDYERHEARP